VNASVNPGAGIHGRDLLVKVPGIPDREYLSEGRKGKSAVMTDFSHSTR